MTGKTVLVTGGSGGIGRQIVKSLAEQGMKVAFTYRNGEKQAEEMTQELELQGLTVKAFKADLRSFEESKDLVRTVAGMWGSIGVLVNNAGIIRDRTLLMMPPEDWSDVVDTNLTGVFNVTKNAIFYMLKEKSGRIINISSTSGISGAAGQANYSASKAGIIGFSRAIAKEVAAYGIAVNVVAPSGVTTDMLDGISQKAKDAMLLSIPAGRFCRPEEVAGVVCYLALGSPLFLTGSVIVMDGGAGLG